MRAVKIAVYSLAAVVALLVLALIAIVVFVDPNDFRDDLEQMVETRTGRELTLEGDLKLSVFPWLALELGPASLGDAPGFGPEPFIAIRHARVGVRVLPLLRGQIEVGAVRLEGARVRLITDAQGRDNWADLGAASQEESAAGTAAPTALPTIAALTIQDAAITMEDRQANTRQTVRDFSLQTGRLASGEPFKLDTEFVLDPAPSSSVKVHGVATVIADLERNAHRLTEPVIDITVSGQGYPKDGVPVRVRAVSLQADISQQLYRLEGAQVESRWRGVGFPADGVALALTAQDLNANLEQQTLELTGLNLRAGDAVFTGALRGEEILDAPRLSGQLKLAPVSPRTLLPQFGVALPQTSDPKVLQQLSFTGALAATSRSVELQNVDLRLDDSTLRGSLGIADFDSQALRFDLDIDRINVDRYLEPAPAEPKSGEKQAGKAAPEAPTPLPIEMLRTLNARGELRIGEAVFGGMTFSKLRLGVNARDGRVRFHPSEASMYGGRYQGDIRIDATGAAAQVALNERIEGVDFAPLFKDLFETERVSGQGNATVKLLGLGRDTQELMNSFDGEVGFKVVNGALEGADLWYEIRRARALLKQRPIPERTGAVRTPFTALTASGVMKDGVLRSQDLNASMQYLRVTGEGLVDLPKSAIDYRLLATVLKIPRDSTEGAELQDLVDAQIPVRVTGALSDPKVRPDLEGYLKNEVKQRVEHEREKVEEKVRDKLQDKLKDIFGR